jgi:hypothetical protein
LPSIQLPIYKHRKLVPVAFVRAATGNPSLTHPAVDDRGYTGTEHGPIVGVLQGDTVTVRLERVRLASDADIYVTSDDPASAAILTPATGKLPSGAHADFQIRGVVGGNPKVVKIFARFGSATGPILGRLAAWVFTPLVLRITPHVASIASATGAAVASTVVVANVMDLVTAIWRPCGIRFTIGATVNDAYTFAVPGQVAWGAEATQLLGHSFVPSTINAHFVNCINDSTSAGVLGWGLSRTWCNANGLANPGIILGDTNRNGSIRTTDAMWIANDLAHEIGHFLRLDHPERKEPPNERTDLWSRRLLMHNFNLQGASGDWHDHFGYGMSGTDVRRGCMITTKDLTQLTTDGECTTSRATITSPSGPY